MVKKVPTAAVRWVVLGVALALIVMVLTGNAHARSTSASHASLTHLTGTKYKGEMVLMARVHMDRAVGRNCPVRIRVAGPTRKVAHVRGVHRTRAHERAGDFLDLRVHLTRKQVRTVFGNRPAGKPARVTIVVGSRTDQCFAPGLRSAAGPSARSGPSTTTITLNPWSARTPMPSLAFFGPGVDSPTGIDVIWGRDMATGDLVPFVQSLMLPSGSVPGCPTEGDPVIFSVQQRGWGSAPPIGPPIAPPTGRIQTDGTFSMTGDEFWGQGEWSDPECWPSSTLTGTFSQLPNAQGQFPSGTTVTATWATAGGNPQTGTVSYPLQFQRTCSSFGLQRCF